jgi:DNA-binding transcriptional LysR family regulator
LWLTWLLGAGRGHRGAIRGPRFSQSEMLISAACAGIGLAVVAFPYVEKELHDGSFVQFFDSPVRSQDSYWLVQPEIRGDIHGVRNFMQWLQREARDVRKSLKNRSLNP